MTSVSLPITSRSNSDPNNFSDVYGNDNALATVVNGGLDLSNMVWKAGTASANFASSAFNDSLVVSHGVGSTPTQVLVSAGALTGGTGIVLDCRAQSITSSQFTVVLCAVPTPLAGGNFVLNGVTGVATVYWLAIK